MEKLVKLRATFDELGINGILITNAINWRYLTEFTGTAGTVLMKKL